MIDALTHIFPLVFLFVVVVILRSYTQLQTKYKQLKYEHDYMSSHILDLHKGITSLNIASRKALPASAQVKKRSSANTKQNSIKKSNQYP